MAPVFEEEFYRSINLLLKVLGKESFGVKSEIVRQTKNKPKP